MAEPYTGYWEPEVGFENIPKFNDKRAELLRWIRKCDSVDGYGLFRLYQKEGVKYPLHSVLISCYGGEPLPEGEESWWLRDVPEYVLDRLEREVDGYDWLISYIVEGVEEKTGNPHNNPNHNEDTLWKQREATQERILDRLKLKESGVKIDEPPLLVTVGTTHTVVGTVDGLKLNFALGEIAPEDVPLFDTFRIHDRVWHVKKSIALSTLKGRQKARDKREGKQMKMYEEWGGLAKFEKKEEPPKERLLKESTENGWLFKKLLDDEYAGSLEIWIMGEGEYKIENIDVAPMFRRRGVATDLINEVINDFAPYNELKWGMQTKEGAKLKKALDEKYNPKPPEPKEELGTTPRELSIDDKVKIEKGAIGMVNIAEREKVIGKSGVIRNILREKGEFVYVVDIESVGWLEHFRSDALKQFEQKEEYKPTTVIEKLADDAIHKRGWWRDKL